MNSNIRRRQNEQKSLHCRVTSEHTKTSIGETSSILDAADVRSHHHQDHRHNENIDRFKERTREMSVDWSIAGMQPLDRQIHHVTTSHDDTTRDPAKPRGVAVVAWNQKHRAIKANPFRRDPRHTSDERGRAERRDTRPCTSLFRDRRHRVPARTSTSSVDIHRPIRRSVTKSPDGSHRIDDQTSQQNSTSEACSVDPSSLTQQRIQELLRIEEDYKKIAEESRKPGKEGRLRLREESNVDAVSNII